MQSRTWGWWRYASRRQAVVLAAMYVVAAVLILVTALTTKASDAFALVAVFPAVLAASWSRQAIRGPDSDT